MAFNINNLNNVTSGAATVGAKIWSYNTEDDDLATVVSSGYFNSVTRRLTQNDLIYIVASDGAELDSVASATGAATVELAVYVGPNSVGTAQLQDDAVTNAKLADDAVSLENLDDGIAPAYITVFAGQHTTGGGSASEAITVTGALATDYAFTQVVNDGTNDRVVWQAVVTTDTLTITFDGDPGAGTLLNYHLIRAAS